MISRIVEENELYNRVLIDDVMYVFREHLTHFINRYIKEGYMTPIEYNSDFIYTRDRCIKNRLMSNETATMVYQKLGKRVMSQDDLNEVKNDIKELVNKVL